MSKLYEILLGLCEKKEFPVIECVKIVGYSQV